MRDIWVVYRVVGDRVAFSSAWTDRVAAQTAAVLLGGSEYVEYQVAEMRLDPVDAFRVSEV